MAATRGRGDEATRRWERRGDAEVMRRGVAEMERRGDAEVMRRGDAEMRGMPRCGHAEIFLVAKGDEQ